MGDAKMCFARRSQAKMFFNKFAIGSGDDEGGGLEGVWFIHGWMVDGWMVGWLMVGWLDGWMVRS